MQALVPIVPYANEGISSSLTLVEIQEYDKPLPMHPPQLDVENLFPKNFSNKNTKNRTEFNKNPTILFHKKIFYLFYYQIYTNES